MTLFRFASRMLASLQLTQTTPSLRKLMPTPFHSSPLAKANKSGPLAHRRSRVATQALSGGGVSTQQVPAMTETKFLDALEGAEQTCGVYLLKKFLSETEADSLYATLNSDSNFPWDLKPKYAGQVLEQHACEFYRGRKDIQKWPGLVALDALCARLETHLDGKVPYVFCNRFSDATHNIPWHTDTYGAHIIVLSLGAQRTIQFRSFKTKAIEDLRPAAGDAYFMPLRVNRTHEHRVCAAPPATSTPPTSPPSASATTEDSASSEIQRAGDGVGVTESAEGAGARISLVFFFTPPKYAKEFEITMGEAVMGYARSIRESFSFNIK